MCVCVCVCVCVWVYGEARGVPVTGGGNEVLSSANIYVTPGFESRPSSPLTAASPVEETLFTC